MKEIDVTSWEHFESCVSELNEHLLARKPDPRVAQGRLLFRGHADSKWRLNTTLERFLKDSVSVQRYNHYLLRIKPAVESYTDRVWEVTREPDLSDFWSVPPSYEFMVYARHHGFPSPLLDWSQSAYIALFFAYADAVPEKSVAVYAYVSNPEGTKGGSANAPKIIEIGPYTTTHARHFMQQAQYTICVQKQDERWDYCCHDDVFKRGDDSQDMLRKINLPGGLRIEFLRKLQLMNINAHSLFGNEESLMRMLAFKEMTLGNL